MKRIDSFSAIDCQLVKPQEAVVLLREVIAADPGARSVFGGGRALPVVEYAGGMASYLCGEQRWGADEWAASVDAYLCDLDAAVGGAVGAAFRRKCRARFEAAKGEDAWGEDQDPHLKTACDVEFSLASARRSLVAVSFVGGDAAIA